MPQRFKQIISSPSLKDFSWYLLGTIVPVLINLVKNPIFTRIFSPDEYGYYSLVFLTFSYLAMVVFSWLASTIWRFYYQDKDTGNLQSLFSNIWICYLAGIIITIAFAATWYLITDIDLIRRLILITTTYFIINDIIGFYLIIIRLEKKAVEYNILQSIRALINFSIVCISVYLLNKDITSLMLGFLFSSIIIGSFIIVKTAKRYPFLKPRFSLFSYEKIKTIFSYGAYNLIAGIALLILTSSDRYVIAIFHSIEKVGIYNQTYAIINLGMAALISAFFNTINPDFNRKLTSKSIDLPNFISKNIIVYLLLFLPITVYISLYSYEFVFIFLGENFREGYKIIPFVILSLFISGLAQYSESKLKFEQKFKTILTSYILAVIINLLLNFIILPHYSYNWAAITTLISYLFFSTILVLNYKVVFIQSLKQYSSLYLSMFIMLISQIIIHLIFNQYVDNDYLFLFHIIEGVVFLMSYVIIIYKIAERKLFSIENNQ